MCCILPLVQELTTETPDLSIHIELTLSGYRKHPAMTVLRETPLSGKAFWLYVAKVRGATIWA